MNNQMTRSPVNAHLAPCVFINILYMNMYIAQRQRQKTPWVKNVEVQSILNYRIIEGYILVYHANSFPHLQ